jgi:hypothetical protein
VAKPFLDQSRAEIPVSSLLRTMPEALGHCAVLKEGEVLGT